MKTGWTALKLALAGFLIPYIFAYDPVLLLIGATPLKIIGASATAIIGVFALGVCDLSAIGLETWPYGSAQSSSEGHSL
jgi:TRAP-type uncharacterized transport system fused permease subunit